MRTASSATSSGHFKFVFWGRTLRQLLKFVVYYIESIVQIGEYVYLSCIACRWSSCGARQHIR